MIMVKSKKAYAKINYCLDVVGKRSDGYHDIVSVMQQTSLYDLVSLNLAKYSGGGNVIRISCDDKNVPCDRRNIAYKCAEKFFSYYNISGYAAEIAIEKHIPSAGGLAGGSSDGAAVLSLLGEMIGVDSSDGELYSIGASVGADIPFCIAGGCCVCRGIGERIEKIALPEMKFHILIAVDGDGVSTPEAYGLIDRMEKRGSADVDAVIDSLKSGEIPDRMYNIFEEVILPIRPCAAVLKEKIISLGGDGVMMSGSGPSIFGLFYDEAVRDYAYDRLRSENIRAYRCEAVV